MDELTGHETNYLYHILTNCAIPELVFLLLTVLKSLLWIIRRNERDIIHLYNSVTPYVEIITGCFDSMDKQSKMLNFGYWTQRSNNPAEAQKELCTIIGEFSDFRSAQRVVDMQAADSRLLHFIGN